MQTYKPFSINRSYDDDFEHFIDLMSDNRENLVVRHQVYYFLIVNGIINIDEFEDEELIPLLYLKEAFNNITQEGYYLNYDELEKFKVKCRTKYYNQNNEYPKEKNVDDILEEFIQLLKEKHQQGLIKDINYFYEIINNFKGDE